MDKVKSYAIFAGKVIVVILIWNALRALIAPVNAIASKVPGN